MDRKKPEQAETIYREAQRIAEKTKPDGWGQFAIQVLVVRSLIAQKRWAEVERMMLDALEGLRRTNAPAATPLKMEALKVLISLRTAAGRLDLAMAHKQELEKLMVPVSP
ncbi:MAG: hypothetical protein EXS32_16460 [Opitutus sp.]|nr:hypothetical protein [Opitutus sp.]